MELIEVVLGCLGMERSTGRSWLVCESVGCGLENFIDEVGSGVVDLCKVSVWRAWESVLHHNMHIWKSLPMLAHEQKQIGESTSQLRAETESDPAPRCL